LPSHSTHLCRYITALTQRIAPHQLVAMLHSLFAAYDRVCAKHDVQKIETIGWAVQLLKCSQYD
jgi:hypothetical protein